jgi:hypothetical protein
MCGKNLIINKTFLNKTFLIIINYRRCFGEKQQQRQKVNVTDSSGVPLRNVEATVAGSQIVSFQHKVA